MNFLAHIALSAGGSDQLMVGNFMGDFIKASKWKALPLEVAQGVLLHRYIDFSTDQHEVSAELRQFLYPVCGKYASIALDMLYDHLLAAEFQSLMHLCLGEFVSETYLRLQQSKALMPERCVFMLNYLISEDWLGSYEKIEGIHHALIRMERRIGREVGFVNVAEVLTENHNRFKMGFHRIFPELQRGCSQKIISFAQQRGDVPFSH